MATIWGAGYSKSYVDFTRDGGAISCATNAAGSVYFKYSAGGVTWPADASAVLVGALGSSSKACHCHQKYGNGKSQIIVTNGIDKMWRSDDYGKTWSAI